MVDLDLKQLIGKLNRYCTTALEAAAGLCVARGNYEVTIEHLLLKLIDDPNGDFQTILRHYEVDEARVRRGVQQAVEGSRVGNPRKPVFSTLLIELIEDAWLIASVDLRLTKVRSGALIAALLAKPNRYAMDEYHQILKDVSVEDLRQSFGDVLRGSAEGAVAEKAEASPGGITAGEAEMPALAQFAINFTEQARSGQIDPVFGRDREIRQMVDILARRRKNNPIVVGEAGVGKTAVVEGLALKIVEEDVPDVLKGVHVYGLDMGLLQAGASVKGEFEQRLKSVINEVKSSPKPIILFIDEAHTLIGAGGSAGGGDAANLLKPALARGELRTIAATTWSEYKKYFEKDAALARRFQLVKVDEPDVNDAVLMMRGLREKYEQAHGIYVRDDAVVASVELAARYLSGRQLPDKSVDLLDTACARVKISISSKPDVLDDKERALRSLERHRDAVSRDIDTGILAGDTALADLDRRIGQLGDEIATLTDRWQREKEVVEKIVIVRKALLDPENESGRETEGSTGDNISEWESRLRTIRGDKPLIEYEVTPQVVGRVVSDWTGIPIGDMVKDEAETILNFAANLRGRIKGQDHAVAAVDRGIKASKAGIGNPHSPMGVFLFVGPSGVGKTECALGMADLLFGGERFVVTVNMSEFQEKHTVSRLIGSPPGYVGYGEGGILTEAVRQRPYSVVLLDEVEKADLEVMNLFYQVFDKGTLSDGEGRVIDFRNTVVVMTSNLASDIIAQMCADGGRPDADTLSQAIRPALSNHFRPALLARMEIVPFYQIDPDAMRDIVRLKLNQLGQRMRSARKMAFTYADEVVEQIAQRCTEVETGARNIDYIVNKTLLPQISAEILGHLNEKGMPKALNLGIGEDGDFSYAFSMD